MILGVLAHVDAGKTTLSEALLYETGKIRTPGRVDHKDTYLDTDAQERERGITIFSKQVQLDSEGVKITLLDTPGHVDFSAEMERTLQVLDYAILVVSGTDGIQGHTKTLWRLLKHYQIPTFIFVNKMDISPLSREQIQNQLKREISEGCVDFASQDRMEEIAMCSDSLLDSFLEQGDLTVEQIRQVLNEQSLIPCFYGSALKFDGVGELLSSIRSLARGVYEQEQENLQKDFGALVYKIGRNAKGERLTYLKVTSGRLHVKDRISYEGIEEKADQIRIYSGEKYEMADEVRVGEVCAVTGLDQTYPGMGLGADQTRTMPILEPVLNYQILVPQGVSPTELMRKIKQLEEEDPQLNILWDEKLQEIHAQLMGQVQMEVLERLIWERFGVKVSFGAGNIVYKETIAGPVEGVGHFEPLRHYAEVHLWMEPAEPGSGISVYSDCSEDILDLNWQRLIHTHILEREHPGVLTGSVITDIKFTIVTGRAHLKHTEGGDFRQATYRAIRQGLKSAESVLLEPYYAYTLEVPVDTLGRAMTDIRNRFGTQEAPEYLAENGMDMAVLTGCAPVSTMQDYVMEVHSYTKGQGRLTLELKGYDVCHNSAEVVEQIGYDSEEDTENPTGSVFCAHGAGYVVPWNEVPEHMHLEYVCRADAASADQGGRSYDLEAQAQSLRELAEKKQAARTALQGRTSSWELDKELQEIYAREFGMKKEDMLAYERRKWSKNTDQENVKKKEQPHQKLDKKGNPIYPKKSIAEDLLIVDGYNILFAVPSLRELSKINIDSAKDSLKDMLVNYQGYCGCRVMLVFDGYRKKGNPGSVEKYYNLEVVHTRQDETADAYIERTVHKLIGKYRITVATNDGLEQLTILSQGALRMSADMLIQEMKRVGMH